MRTTASRVLALLGMAIAAQVWMAQAEPAAPRELGRVSWGRDLDGALARAAADGRPVFLLFQEVPGCSTCVSFGEQVLSDALLVEAIETEFVPVFVYNNRAGRDASILERFGEPAWNNPVVRFLDGAGRDLVPRRTGVWTPHAIGERMALALERAGRDVPPFLRAAVDEARPRLEERASFGMACYWSGEACLGAIPGILSSRTGVLGGSEVVELRFDPDVISYSQLLAEAERRACANSVFAHSSSQLAAARAVFGAAVELRENGLRPASERDQKYYLRRSPLRQLELTPRQALRVNAALAAGLDPEAQLSPRQRERLARR